jgi:hypothetical protein
MTIDISTLQEIQEALGPKRVKTPQQEVEQFELRDLLQAANSHGTKKPSLMNIGWTRVVPKYSCHCPVTPEEDRCCE